MTPRQSPVKRKNPSGDVVWVARYKAHGKRRIAKPPWNGGKGSFAFKRDAQRAIDEALELVFGLGVTQPDTLGNYRMTWTRRHPRSERTNKTNEDRVDAVLDVEMEDGRLLHAWRFDELRRKHALFLVDHMLREQGRAIQGVRNILGALSIMTENAIDDEVAGDNAWKGIRLRKNDPRAQKAPKPIRIWTFEQSHAFAAASDHEIFVRTFFDCGLRLGEVLPLERADFDGEVLTIERTAHEGKIEAGTKTDHGEPAPGRIVPVPPTLARMLAKLPPRIDTKLMFSTPTGKLWRERNFYRDVWYPAQLAWALPILAARGVKIPTEGKPADLLKALLKLVRAHGLDPRPHEGRHSYVTQLRAAGIDDADLADTAGHTVETMIGSYTHPMRRSDDAIREAIG